MKPELPDPVAFLSSGLVHQFGNLLFTIQGHAVVLDADNLERGRAAIATACDRGTACLRLLRHLLGEPGLSWLPAADATAQVVELLRVPVREAGHTVEMRLLDDARSQVELGAFVPALVAAVQALVAAVPNGVAGQLLVACRTEAGRAHVAVTFRQPAGNLPFPLAIEACVARLRLLAGSRRHPWVVHGHGATLDIGLPTAQGAVEA